jgi:hypothetical protein
MVQFALMSRNSEVSRTIAENRSGISVDSGPVKDGIFRVQTRALLPRFLSKKTRKWKGAFGLRVSRGRVFQVFAGLFLWVSPSSVFDMA